VHAVAGFDVKKLRDRIGLVSAESDKRVTVASLGFNGDSADHFGGGGWNVFSAGLAGGDLNIQSPTEKAADALTARSDGGFTKVHASVARLQSVRGPLSLFAAVRGQFSTDNLDTSEKMPLAAPTGCAPIPRARLTATRDTWPRSRPRLLLGGAPRMLAGQLQLIGFVDGGEVNYSVDPWSPGSNHARRSGVGAGVTWAGPHDLVLKASYARKLGDEKATSAPDRDGRAWFHVSKLFR
jgi:hemolysin activation/secretion protein